MGSNSLNHILLFLEYRGTCSERARLCLKIWAQNVLELVIQVLGFPRQLTLRNAFSFKTANAKSIM